MERNEYTSIPAEKFRFVQANEKLHDKALKTKPIGYFKDAWIRFRKNKASVAAAIVLAIIILYALLVPIFSVHKLGEKADATYKKMFPRLYIGETAIFDGAKTMSLNDKYLINLVAVGMNAEDPEMEKTGHESWEEGIGSYYSPILSLGDDREADASGKEGVKRDARVSTYNIIGFKYLQITKEEYEAIRTWEQENEVKVLYPMVNTADKYCEDASDANYWYKTKKGWPVDSKGKRLELEQTMEQGVIDNFLRDKEGNILYYKEMGTMYSVRVLYYNYYRYTHGYEPTFVFGTDGGGYDIATRMAYGLRTSFVLSFGVAVVCFIFGAFYGAIEGYYGGWTDLLMERIVDILWRMPLYIIVVLFQLHLVNTGKASVLGGLLMAFCVTGWIGTASLVRTQFYRFKNQEYILAARTLGAKDLRLMFRHIFPNAIGTIITSSVFAIPSVIMSESTFSYLGIVNLNSRNTVSLGTMMADGKEFLSEFPHILLIPAAVIALMMIAFNLFGNGLRDAFNPSLRGADE